MNLEQISSILEEIKGTSSTKSKLELLQKQIDNVLLKKVLYYTYNPFMNYGISETKLRSMVFDKTNILKQDIFVLLDKLAFNNINDSLREEFIAVCNSLTDVERELMFAIVRKDLRIGVNVSSINKVYKGLIPVFNVQLANKISDVKLKEDETIYLTEKLDGVRCIAIKEDDIVNLYTRQGKPIIGLVEIEDTLMKVKGDWVFDGELILKTNDKVDSGTLYRMTVKAVNNKQDTKTGIMFNVFDVLTPIEFRQGVSKTKYSQRRQNLELINRCVLREMEFVKIVKLLYVGEDHTMIAHYLKEMESLDKEGVMVNREDFYYCKRCNSLLKVKSMNTCDLKIIGFESGLGKNENTLGSLIVDYKGYELRVGSGYSQEMRDEIWKNQENLLGRIVEVQYFEESKNQNGGLSLRFPVFKCIRELGKEVSYS